MRVGPRAARGPAWLLAALRWRRRLRADLGSVSRSRRRQPRVPWWMRDREPWFGAVSAVFFTAEAGVAESRKAPGRGPAARAASRPLRRLRLLADFLPAMPTVVTTLVSVLLVAGVTRKHILELDRG